MATRQTVLNRTLTTLRNDLERSERILAAGGFEDADGNWIEIDPESRQQQVADLKSRISRYESELARAN